MGLYMDPLDKAVVICMNEKARIQALDRSQTVLPLRPGMPASRSWDYKRNGTIDLFAALNVLDGTVVTQFHRRHRHQEFLIYLRNSFSNVRALVKAIKDFVAEYQKNPHPFVCTARADDILRKVASLRQLQATGQ